MESKPRASFPRLSTSSPLRLFSTTSSSSPNSSLFHSDRLLTRRRSPPSLLHASHVFVHSCVPFSSSVSIRRLRSARPLTSAIDHCRSTSAPHANTPVVLLVVTTLSHAHLSGRYLIAQPVRTVGVLAERRHLFMCHISKSVNSAEAPLTLHFSSFVSLHLDVSALPSRRSSSQSERGGTPGSRGGRSLGATSRAYLCTRCTC